MSLGLEGIEYHCAGKGNFFARVLVADGEKEFSGEGESKDSSEDAIWKATIKALCPFNIINMAKVVDLQILPNVAPEIFIVALYGNKELIGRSRNKDRPLAIAEALLDLHKRFMAQS